MLSENIKIIKESEEKAEKIIEDATSRGREILKDAELKILEMEKKLKERIDNYRIERFKIAEKEANEKIKANNEKTLKEIENLTKAAEKKIDQAVNLVFDYILSL